MHSEHRRVGTFAAWASFAVSQAVVCVSVGSAQSHSVLMGRILDDSSRRVVAAASVSLPHLNMVAMSDSLGQFRLRGLPAGMHLTVVRAMGFRSETVFVDLGTDETFSRDFRLARLPVSISGVEVVARPDSSFGGKLSGFHERRRSQVGHFLDSAQMSSWANRRAGDMMSLVPGIELQRAGGKAYAVGSRAQPSLINSRQRDPCYMDVYLDGALVYTNAVPGAPPFDLNGINVQHIAAIEAYASSARIPAQFNKTSKGCGVIVIWTR